MVNLKEKLDTFVLLEHVKNITAGLSLNTHEHDYMTNTELDELIKIKGRIAEGIREPYKVE